MSRLPSSSSTADDDTRLQQIEQQHETAAANKKSGVFLKQGGASLAEEDDEGSVEYKWRLVGITEQRLNHLVTQMKFRVAEGRGECIYEIGVEDDGFTRGLPQAEFDESIATLRTMAARLGFTLDINCVVSKTNPKDPSQLLKCAEVRVQKIVETLPTCRIAITGDTDSGKSTLVGVIASGALDDGSGTVRQSVFNHKHELKSGQTSSVGVRIVGFAKDGTIVNYDGDDTVSPAADGAGGAAAAAGAAGAAGSAAAAAAAGGGPAGISNSSFSTGCNLGGCGVPDRSSNDVIAERSATLTMLMDLPGHLKRSHTALSALVGRFPHIVALVISPANPKNVAAHIAQCAALQLPFFVVFTNQDSTQPLALGQAAAAVDRAVGAETGKRLVMVSAPIYPGENDGFNHREMIHTSSDMFLSDLGSNDGSPTAAGTNEASGPPSPRETPHGGMSVGSAEFPSSVASTPGKRNNLNRNNNNSAGEDDFDDDGGGFAAATTAQRQMSRNPVEAYLESHVPVFVVSSVTGYGIPLLKHFLHQMSLTPPRLAVDYAIRGGEQTIRVVVDKVYVVQKKGLIASGTITSGTIRVGQKLFWGPARDGTFFPVQVASLHYQRNFVHSVADGNECCVAFERGDQLAPDVVAMSQRKGTMLFGSGSTDHDILPPATSRDFRVIVSKAQAVASAQEWKVDQELTAFVFSAKQACFLRKLEPVDPAAEEYAAVRAERSVGDAARPLILHCSFVYLPEVLVVGAPIVLLRNTPDARLGAVAGRIYSFDACVRREATDSSSESVTPPRSPTAASSTSGGGPDSVPNTTPGSPNTSGGGGGGGSLSRANSGSPAAAAAATAGGQFPSVAALPTEAAPTMKKHTSSPPETPTTHPAGSAQQQQQSVLDAADLSVARERAERKKAKAAGTTTNNNNNNV